MALNLDVPNSEAAILTRALQPERGDLSPDAAKSLLNFSISEVDNDRARELAAKARAGTLDAAEEAEINNYRGVGRLLELLKSKARLSLKQASAA